MSDLDTVSRMQLDIGQPCDFPALMLLRKEVFVDELGVQDETYRDVFSDWYSKNILLRCDRKIVGAVRLAFSRDQQEFYVSYLMISKSHRKQSYLRLLFGAAIHVLQVNHITSVRADSGDLNLSMYLSAGCKILGPKFRKYGFNCDWTPLRYVVGTNGIRERKIVKRAAMLLNDDEHLIWRFSPNILCCEDQSSYGKALIRFIESNGSAEILPHVGPNRLMIRSNVIATDTVVFYLAGTHTAKTREPDLPMLFDRLNETLSRDHIVIVNRHSTAIDVARTFCACTGKYLVCLDRIDDITMIDSDHVKSALWLIDSPMEIPEIVLHLNLGNDYPIGFVPVTSATSASLILLSTFLHFLQPIQMLRHPVQWVDPQFASSYFAHNVVFREELFAFIHPSIRATAIGIIGKTHCIVSSGMPGAEIAIFISTLLSAGFPIGTTVRFANLAYAEESVMPLVLIGDPSVRLTPQRPCQTDETFGDSEFRMVAYWYGGSCLNVPSLLHVTWQRRTEHLASPIGLGNMILELGEPRHTAFCANHDLQHMFIFGGRSRVTTVDTQILHELEDWQGV